MIDRSQSMKPWRLVPIPAILVCSLLLIVKLVAYPRVLTELFTLRENTSLPLIKQHWVNVPADMIYRFYFWEITNPDEGGPSWASNTVDSPIIVNATNDEFLKESMYYMMAHFSKFLKPGSQIAKLTLPLLSPVQAVGAVMVDGRRYISVLNQNHLTDVTISIQEKGVASVYTPVTVPKRSIATIIWGTSQ